MASAASLIDKASESLHRIFGFSQFRGVQEHVIERVLAHERTLAVMPTGAGKSLCYQLPSVMFQGTTIVISPLIALMHDQLRAAEAIGIRAATLTSVDTNRTETMERFRKGQLDLLYVAPERASGAEFRMLLREGHVALFAIDEAHCVSEWGHDFRPDYRLLRPMMDDFPDVPRLALTATADAHTRSDILAQLGIPIAGMIVAGFDRPNIRYAISPRAGTANQIINLVETMPGAGIVYVPSRHGTEKLAAQLSAKTKRPVRAYHAGLDPEVRARNQGDFVASEDMIMVATVAFGMGIDKPDVRFVAHAGRPNRLRPIIRKRAVRAVMAIHQRRICSGVLKILLRHGNGCAILMTRACPVNLHAYRLWALWSKRRDAGGQYCSAILGKHQAKAAAIATIASTRPAPLTQAWLRKNSYLRSTGPGKAMA